HAPAPPHTYTLSLHDALPIYQVRRPRPPAIPYSPKEPHCAAASGGQRTTPPRKCGRCPKENTPRDLLFGEDKDMKCRSSPSADTPFPWADPDSSESA